MVSQRAVMIMQCATVAMASYTTIADIPDSCTPSPLVPDNGRCIFSFQCASGFCCPFFKSCLGNDGYTPLASDAVEADALRKKMMWTSAYGGEADCGKSSDQTCDVCAMRECSQAMTCDMCSEVNGQPLFEGNDWGMPAWNIADPKCGCHPDFVAAFQAGTWVEGCTGTGSGSSAGKALAVATSNMASKHDFVGWLAIMIFVSFGL